MRNLLLIAVIVGFSGCAGTHKVRMPDRTRAGSSHTTPVVLQPPSASARSEYKRQQDAETALQDATTVEGDIRR